MAERRAFSQSIVESDAFLEMKPAIQALYFHICMNARDKGLVNNARAVANSIGLSGFAISELVDRGYLKKAGDSEYEIVHWYENNGIGETAKKRNNYKYRKWREAVIARDGSCLKCGSLENLEAHHIKSFAEHPLDRFAVSNGLTYCHDCHKQIHKEARDLGRSKVDQDCD